MFKKRKLIFQLIITIFSAILFFIYNNDFYYSDSAGYIVADSKRYVELAKHFSGLEGLFSVTLINKNLFGPLLYYDLILQENRYLFFTVTFFFFFIALMSLHKNLSDEKNKDLILFLIIANPIVISSFSGPNKEIVGYISILYLINYMLKNKLKYIFMAIMFSIFARWELLLVIIGFLILRKIKYRKTALFFLIVLISFVVSYYDYSYDAMINHMPSRDNSLGFVSFLAELNQKGLYFLTLIPKLFINFFGEIIVANPFNLSDYSLMIYFSQLVFLILVIKIKKRKVLNFKNQFFLFLLVFSLIFTTPAFIQHRYFIPLYPIIVILAFLKNKSMCCLNYDKTYE